MKPKVLLIETKCPPGHVNLYRAQISEMCERFDVTLATTEAYGERFRDLPVTLHVIGGTGVPGPRKLAYRLEQLAMLRKALRFWREGTFDRGILLSYDTVALALAGRFAGLQGLRAVNHNNIDDLLRSRLKRLAIRAIPDGVTFVSFEPYISDFLQSEFGVSVETISHPRRRISSTSGPTSLPAQRRAFVFCPSAECDRGFLDALIDHCERSDLMLVTKPHGGLPNKPGIVVRERFEDYDALFLAADYIAIGVDYRYRVSGVFYEASANDKKVLAKECLFMKSVESDLKFPPIYLRPNAASA